MTCPKIRFCSAICLPLLVLSFGEAAALAQNTPEMHEVLTRLDRLEKDNQALIEEIRALRQELARLSPASAADLASADGAAIQDDQPGTNEQRAVEQSRIQRARANQSGGVAEIPYPRYRHGSLQRLR